MRRLDRPSSRILSCLLGLLMLAQLGLMGMVRAAQPQWVEICSATGTRYLPAGDPQSTATVHDDGSHCPACPLGQPALAHAAPSPLVFGAALAGLAPPVRAAPWRAGPHWPAALARGPPSTA